MKRTLYAVIAWRLQAAANCKASNNTEWQERHTQFVHGLVRAVLPSGGGFDSGTYLLIDQCDPDRRLVFATEFHHMDPNGFYDGWTKHTIVVTPSFDGINVRVTGRDRNDIKDYIADMFGTALQVEIDDATTDPNEVLYVTGSDA